MKSKISQTCKELIVGIILISMLALVCGAILTWRITGNWLQFIFGVLLGACVAIVLAIHMDHSIDTALDMDSDGATKYTRKKSAIRFLIMVAAIVVALTFPKVFHPIGVLLGIMALKLSAYIQPLTSKYISK